MSRPPSARAHEEVLAVAVKLIGERGIDGLSVDAISEESGVSKATIYKHWTNKEALCLEAISTLQSGLPEVQAGDARSGMVQLLRHLGESPRPRALMKIMPKVFGHASQNPAFAKAWAERIEEPRRARLRQLIEQGIAEGQLRSDVDMELAVHLLFGPILYYRLMHSRSRAGMPAEMPERVVDLFWRAYGK